jgi:hypothetical protein
MSRVFVFGPEGEPLNPCHPARARELLRKRRAQVVSARPYAIRLVVSAPGRHDSAEALEQPIPAEPASVSGAGDEA